MRAMTMTGTTKRTKSGIRARALVLATALALVGGVQAVAAQSADGEEIYRQSCAQCHGPDGQGAVGFYPPLDGDPFVTQIPQLPIQVVLEGRALSPITPPMPAFADQLSDREVAAVVSYIRGAWGNDAGSVDASAVAGFRSQMADAQGVSGEMPAGWREQGEDLYARNCAACHQPQGEGADDIFPALAGNPIIVGTDGPYLVHLLRSGRGGMPAFERSMGAEALASVLSYVRSAWGNDAAPVTPRMVRDVAEAELEESPHGRE